MRAAVLVRAALLRSDRFRRADEPSLECAPNGGRAQPGMDQAQDRTTWPAQHRRSLATASEPAVSEFKRSDVPYHPDLAVSNGHRSGLDADGVAH